MLELGRSRQRALWPGLTTGLWFRPGLAGNRVAGARVQGRTTSVAGGDQREGGGGSCYGGGCRPSKLEGVEKLSRLAYNPGWRGVSKLRLKGLVGRRATHPEKTRTECPYRRVENAPFRSTKCTATGHRSHCTA